MPHLPVADEPFEEPVVDGVVPASHLAGEDQVHRPARAELLRAFGARSVVVDAEVRLDAGEPSPQPPKLGPPAPDLDDEHVLRVRPRGVVVFLGERLAVGAQEVGEDRGLSQAFLDVLVVELPIEVPPEGRQHGEELAVVDVHEAATRPGHIPPGPAGLGEALALLLPEAPEHVAGEAEVLYGRGELALRFFPEPEELGPLVVRHKIPQAGATDGSSTGSALMSASHMARKVVSSPRWSVSLSRVPSRRPWGSGWS